MEEKQLHILNVNNTKEENPSYFYRNKIVGKALSKRGHNVFYATQGSELDLTKYDIIVFNRFYEGSLINELVALKKMGKIIVYEVDDNYFAMDSRLPLWKIEKYAKPSAYELMVNSDAITTSTQYLKNSLRKQTHTPIFVIPNAIDLSDYQQRENKNKQIKIGWQGSNVHISDLLSVIKPIKKLQKKHKFKFIIFGLDDNKIEDFYKFAKKRKTGEKWSRDLIKLYEELKTMDFEHIPFTSTVEEYRIKLSMLDLDIGICPLLDTDFNRSKSCLKYYEYAAVGTPALASDVIPYNTEMYKKDLARGEKEWELKLEKLITDDEYRNQRSRIQMDWLRGHRNINDIVLWWEEVYKVLVKKKKLTKMQLNNTLHNNQV
jgi:glycosyltransferase involved in cell wall biosynthesis